MMTCQQLTTVCIFMTTCQIAPAPWPFDDLIIPSELSMLNYNLPPKLYHYEPFGHILKTYPKNSYKIKYGLSNIIRNNNKRRKSSLPRGSNSNKKSKEKKKSENQSPENFPFIEPPENLKEISTENSPANPEIAEPPTNNTPVATSPADSPGTE